MECLESLVWNSYTKDELMKLSIERPGEDIRKKVLKNWDGIAKPIDGMGAFETITAQIGSIVQNDTLDISRKAVIIMCADNGIVEEGVTQSGQEVTLAVAESMAKKCSSVGRMADLIDVDTIPVDIGINSEKIVPNVLNRKIRLGTRNFSKEPAMTEEETIRAIATGIELVCSCKKNGYHMLATGEMGIGNTTTSSAIVAALTGCEAGFVTGRGAGLSDEGLVRKIQVIQDAIHKYDLYQKDAFTVLSHVGGLDIAGLTGVCIGGAIYHVPIVLDGVISMAAALVAERLFPGIKDYLLPSHKGKEPAVELLMKELSLCPVIDARLALGEGTGAVMMFSLLDMALSIYHSNTTFSDIQIDQYERFSKG